MQRTALLLAAISVFVFGVSGIVQCAPKKSGPMIRSSSGTVSVYSYIDTTGKIVLDLPYVPGKPFMPEGFREEKALIPIWMGE